MKETVGSRIFKIRQGKDYTQQNVADELGIQSSTYSKYERGETDIPLSRLLQIAEVLEVDVTDFFQDIATKKTSIQDTKQQYGFATKADIEEVMQVIQKLARELSHLKNTQQVQDVKKAVAKRKK